jgi:hypothetical protein
VSFVSLFYEMLVVRWLAGECRVYGYYANLPLITAFFGLGLRCLLAKRQLGDGTYLERLTPVTVSTRYQQRVPLELAGAGDVAVSREF